MIDPGDNEWTRWINALKQGDPVEHVDGTQATIEGFGTISRHGEEYYVAIVCVHGRLVGWALEDLTPPAPPALLARQQEEE